MATEKCPVCNGYGKVYDRCRLYAVVLLAWGLMVGAAIARGNDLAGEPQPVATTATEAQTAGKEGAVPPAPSDPFQRCARAALAGCWGPLPHWKAEAYRRGLEEGVTVRGRVWVTAYYPWEGRSGRVDCRGNRCTDRTAACNRLPYGTVIWLEDPCGLRVVLDRGSRRNDRIAARRGCDLWVDLWRRQRMEAHIAGYALP